MAEDVVDRDMKKVLWRYSYVANMEGQQQRHSDGLVEEQWVFQFVQSGIFLMVLGAGIACLGHIVFVLRKGCFNAGFIFALTFTGFCHLHVCVRLNMVRKDTAVSSGVNVCIDYSLPAMIGNAGVFMLIMHKLILQTAATTAGAVLIRIFSFGSIMTGLILALGSSSDHGIPLLNRVSSMSKHATPSSPLDVSWPICEKRVSSEITNVMIEYLIVYLPVVVVVMLALVSSFRRTREISCLKLVILSNKECVSTSGTCVCAKLNAGLVSVLSFAAIMLLIVKPGYMVYASATSGNFRDLIPSLVPMALLLVICFEYILKVIVQRGR